MVRITVGAALLLLSVTGSLAQDAGNALSFDGADDFALIPHSDLLDFATGSAATFELWLNPTTGPAVFHVFGKRSSCTGDLSDINYQLADSLASALHFRTGTCVVENIQIPRDVWSHVAITSDGSTTTLYLNGSLRGRVNCSMAGSNTADLKIGASSTCGSRFLGAIDEFRVWGVARSASDIAGSLDSALSLPAPGLVGYWKFDEDIGEQIVMDSSAAGNDGTLGQDGTAASDDPTRVASTAPAFDGSFIFADGFESGDTSGWSA